MKYLRIDHCACGNPIFPPLLEIIIDHYMKETIGMSKTKRKGKARQEIVGKLCFPCKINHFEKKEKEANKSYYKRVREGTLSPPRPKIT
jgi:hypothetical protein